MKTFDSLWRQTWKNLPSSCLFLFIHIAFHNNSPHKARRCQSHQQREGMDSCANTLQACKALKLSHLNKAFWQVCSQCVNLYKALEMWRNSAVLECQIFVHLNCGRIDMDYNLNLLCLRGCPQFTKHTHMHAYTFIPHISRWCDKAVVRAQTPPLLSLAFCCHRCRVEFDPRGYLHLRWGPVRGATGLSKQCLNWDIRITFGPVIPNGVSTASAASTTQGSCIYLLGLGRFEVLVRYMWPCDHQNSFIYYLL